MRNLMTFFMMLTLSAVVLATGHSGFDLGDGDDFSPISASDACVIASHISKAQLAAEAPELLKQAYAAIHKAVLDGEVSTNVALTGIHRESVEKTVTALHNKGYIISESDTLNGGRFLTISWDHE